MKKLLAILLLLCMVCALTACPGEPPTPSPGGETPGGETPGGETPGGDTPGGETPDNETPGGDTTPPEEDEVTFVQTYPYIDENDVLHIRYQDTYTFDTSIKDIVDVNITSTKTGTVEKDATLFVEQKDGKTVYADGCGTATVLFRGDRTVRVQVDPSPINLFFVTGQSNASGDPSFSDPSYAAYFKRSPETMAYFTFCGQQISIDIEGDRAMYAEAVTAPGGAIWGAKEPNFTDYRLNVPTTLDWETTYAAAGCDPRVFTKETTDFVCSGWNAALAYEWIQQTGERIWIVNCSQGGMEIQQFLPGEDGSVVNNEYYQAVAVFNLALETLYKEVDAGHFTLHHMAYYWFQGEANSYKNETGEYTGFENHFVYNRGRRYLSDAEYAEMFAKVHTGFMRDVVYNHNGVTKELEYCGIMTLRGTGVAENSLGQLSLLGPRGGQYYMGATTEDVFKNVYVVSNVTEQWVGATTEDADAKVTAYFLNKYGSAEKFKAIFGYDIPTTAYELHPNVHYLMKGHNEIGMDCARNSLLLINMLQPEEQYKLTYKASTEPTIRLLAADGMTELTDTIVFDKNTKTAMVCPRVEPLYLAANGVELRVTGDAFSFDAYTLTCHDNLVPTVEITVLYNGEVYKTCTFAVEFQ